MKLFEPGKIGTMELKNRIVMAPMGVGALADANGELSQRGLDYHIARAEGGTGLIITGAAPLNPEAHTSLTPHITVDSPAHAGWLSRLADAMHRHDARVAVELSAGLGRVARFKDFSKADIVAPSAQPSFWAPEFTARALTIEEIEHQVEVFALAARIISNTGIDAIELHGHSGYLLDQFMTATWNRRTDKYGGDLEGRLRFPMEIIRAIKREAGASFPVIFRFGLTHYLPEGRQIEEGLEIARRLEAAGVDGFDVDAGSYETLYWAKPTTYSQPGCLAELAGMVKKVVKVPVMAVGKLGYPDLAERVLQDGKADFIAIGRALLADPDWPNKVKEGRPEDIRPCIGDYEGCNVRVWGGESISCTVNPACGAEKELAIKPADRPKSVLVVGGGPGGMEAARVAALRGHRVTLWEKADALGGSLIAASAPDFKEDFKSLIAYLSTQIRKLGVTVELNKEATPELIQQMKPEVVFVATGSTPVIPGFPMTGKDKVVTAADVLLGRKTAGESVVVIGGGSIGCETALHLARQGRKVTVVEMTGNVASDMFSVNRMHLMQLLADARVRVLTDMTVTKVTGHGAVMTGKDGKSRTLPAQTVVLAVGLKPNDRLSQALKGKVPEVYAVGDCVQPRRVINAIWEAFSAARSV